MWALVEDQLINNLKEKPEIASIVLEIEEEILNDGLSPFQAAERIIQLFRKEE